MYKGYPFSFIYFPLTFCFCSFSKIYNYNNIGTTEYKNREWTKKKVRCEYNTNYYFFIARVTTINYAHARLIVGNKIGGNILVGYELILYGYF